MASEPWQPLLQAFENLRDNLPVQWDWDKRFGCALATVSADAEERTRAAVTAQLPRVWTGKTLAGAPDDIRAFAEEKGGLRDSQLLFCSEPVAEMFGYALWWPWGGNEKISIRVGIAGGGQATLPQAAIRVVFGIG